jgi:serine/threonine protein kinase
METPGQRKLLQLLVEVFDMTEEDREDHLIEACGDDDELLAEARETAAVDEQTLGDFLKRPALAEVAGHARRKTSTRPRPTTVLVRLRKTPGLWLFAVLLAGIALLVASSAVGTIAALQAPTLGIACSSLGGQVVFVADPLTGVRHGDVIQKIDGRYVGGDSRRIRASLLDLRPGPVTLQLQRPTGDGKSLTVTLQAAPHGLRHKVETWLRLFTGAILMLVGVGAFMLRPVGRVAWLFLLFCLTLGSHLLIYNALVHLPPEGLLLESVLLFLCASFGLHLSALFPQRLFGAGSWTRLFYIPAALATAIELLFYSNPESTPLLIKVVQAGNVWAVMVAIAAVFFLALQYQQARGGRDAVALARSRAMLLAVSLGLALPASLRLFLPPGLQSATTSSALIVLFVAITGYSVLRYNALDLDHFTAAGVAYGGTTALLGMTFALVLVGGPALLAIEELLSSPVAVAASTAAFFAFFGHLYRRVRRRVDRWFQLERPDEGYELGLLQRLADTVRHTKLTETFSVALDVAMTLRSERAEIWLLSPDASLFVRWQSDRENSQSQKVSVPLPAYSALIRSLRTGSGGVARLTERPFESAAQDDLWNRELALAAPIFFADELHGFLALGPKRSGLAFSKRDRSFLDTVASQISIAVKYDQDHGERLGPYQLRQRLGSGGMAEVYLADKRGLGGFELRVAVKRILPHLNQDAATVAMFLDEARIAAKLHHPHIVQVFDVEKHQESYMLAMELMDGPALLDLLRICVGRGTLLPLPFTVAVTQALLSALEYVHNRKDNNGNTLGLVHRDVKPGNILTTREGEIKLTDFGVARAASRLYQTQPGLVRGTPAYMSPEQRLQEDTGCRSDLYSAGAVIYEMLTAHLPYSKPSHQQRFLPPSRWVSSLPPAMDDFCQRSLAKSASARFASAREMFTAFQAAIMTPPASREELVAVIEEHSSQDCSTTIALRQQLDLMRRL